MTKCRFMNQRSRSSPPMPGSSSNKKKAHGRSRVLTSNLARTSNRGSASVGSVMSPQKPRVSLPSETKMTKRSSEAASTRVSSKKLVKSSLTKKKRPSSHGLRESLEKNEVKLPKLLKGWEWQVRNGFYAACLFTWEYDCIVEIRDAALHLSTGVAPIEIVKAVLKANNLCHRYQKESR